MAIYWADVEVKTQKQKMIPFLDALKNDVPLNKENFNGKNIKKSINILEEIYTQLTGIIFYGCSVQKFEDINVLCNRLLHFSGLENYLNPLSIYNFINVSPNQTKCNDLKCCFISSYEFKKNVLGYMLKIQLENPNLFIE